MYKPHLLNPVQFFVLFALCCLLPFIAAKLALSLAWFSPGATNKGDWLAQDIQLPASGYWQLVYVQTEHCDSQCELALYSLQQLYTGLGAKNEHVNVGVIAQYAAPQLARYPALHWQAGSSEVAEQLQGQLLLVNRQGQLLLHYSAITDQQQALVSAKKMRSDLLRLLAFDRPAPYPVSANGHLSK